MNMYKQMNPGYFISFKKILAAISLLVGSIGIMNTMYTSVLQRTQEIGIMKSIGARNSTIAGLFLMDGIVIYTIDFVHYNTILYLKDV